MPRKLTESEMNKIDDAISPTVRKIVATITDIECRVPTIGSTNYKRSPVRSVKSALRHLQLAAKQLQGLE